MSIAEPLWFSLVSTRGAVETEKQAARDMKWTKKNNIYPNQSSKKKKFNLIKNDIKFRVMLRNVAELL